jgi:D-amino-acid dehydrogenase
VTVFERHRYPAMETSFANGGQISAVHAEPWARPGVLPKILRWIGREDAPLRFRPRPDLAQWQWALRFLGECLPGRLERNTRELAGLALYSRECLIELRERTAIRYDELRRGILHFCTEERDFEALARHAMAMRQLGIQREVKTAAECIAIEPALRASSVPVFGGIYTPQDESGDAHAFTRALADKARERGVAFLYGRTIEAIDAAADLASGVRLRGEARRVDADAYVVALGSYSPLILAALGVRIPVYPLKGYSVTLPLPHDAGERAPSVSLTDEAHKIVITRMGERLRAAGTAELAGYDASIDEGRCKAIVARVRQLFPALDTSREARYWAGLRPATPSNVPVIGRTRLRNLFLNTGHGTLGWTLACGSARALADLMSGRRPDVRFAFA